MNEQVNFLGKQDIYVADFHKEFEPVAGCYVKTFDIKFIDIASLSGALLAYDEKANSYYILTYSSLLHAYAPLSGPIKSSAEALKLLHSSGILNQANALSWKGVLSEFLPDSSSLKEERLVILLENALAYISEIVGPDLAKDANFLQDVIGITKEELKLLEF